MLKYLPRSILSPASDYHLVTDAFQIADHVGLFAG